MRTKVYSQPPTAVFSTVLQSHYSALTTRQYVQLLVGIQECAALAAFPSSKPTPLKTPLNAAYRASQ